MAGTLTLQRIKHDLTAAHSRSQQGRSATARALYAGPTPTATATATAAKPTAQDTVCFHFRDKGTCKWGDRCRYSHGSTSTPGKSSQLTGSCVVCASPAHGINQCPVHQKKKKQAASTKQKEATAMLAKLSEEVAEMRALTAKPAPTPPPTSTPPDIEAAQAEIQRLRAQLSHHPPTFNPYYAYGPGSAPP